VQDDIAQTKAAQDLMAKFTEAEPGFICCEVLIELAWVLERAYALRRPEISWGLCCTNRVTDGSPLSPDRLIPRFQ
jgi:hypothetical protein